MKFIWEKLGLVFTPNEIKGKAWIKSHAQAPASLILEDRVRMYFSCRQLPDNQGQHVSNTAYVDLDLNDPRKILNTAQEPVLKLGGLGSFDEFGIYPFSPIKVEDKVFAFYGGWTRMESVPFNVSIGCAISRDNGISFERIGKGPIISYSPEEPFILSSPRIRKFNETYYLFYIAGKKWLDSNGIKEPIYKIRSAYSNDLINWQKTGEDLIKSNLGIYESQASPDVFAMDGRYHMFFCFRSHENYRGGIGSYQIGYATSSDLVNWRRDDSLVTLKFSPGQWDSQMQAYPHVFSAGNNIYLAYIGNDFGKDGFGLAKLLRIE